MRKTVNQLCNSSDPSGREQAKQILDERAYRLSLVPEMEESLENTIEITTFLLGNEHFGIESNCVKEVVKAPKLAPIPMVPEFILGLVNLRGEILMVVDILAFFGVKRDITGFSNILVLGQDDFELGIAIHSANEVKRIQEANLVNPPVSISEIAKDFIKGVSQGALTILDAHKMFNDERLFVGEKQC